MWRRSARLRAGGVLQHREPRDAKQGKGLGSGSRSATDLEKDSKFTDHATMPATGAATLHTMELITSVMALYLKYDMRNAVSFNLVDIAYGHTLYPRDEYVE